MNKIVSTIIFFSLAATAQAQTAGEATIRLTGTTLMHEMRATPSPLDGAEISDRAVSFQWPLPAGLNILRSGLDGAEENTPKKKQTKASYATSCATRKLRHSSRKRPYKPRRAGRSSTPNRIWLQAHGTGNTAMLRTERPNGAIRCNLR